jgi:succinyl-CoA synthetase beta subunit
MNSIETAITNGQRALSEYQSKQYLQSFGIPVTRETLVQTADEAVTAAEQIGFPVALKACSPELMHKSETGGILLNLATADAIERAYAEIQTKIQIPLDGYIVQEMLEGSRELVVGMIRDPQFGVCVMLGLGGVMAEILKDTVFRVAPFDKTEAMDMIDELQSKEMLKAFRGQQPADLETLCQALIAVGRIGLEEERIAEIDINPMIIAPDGRITAADALLILDRK